MAQETPLIRNISDTARWVAVYRAQESERPDAVFQDPFARRLAGKRGEEIAASLEFGKKSAWSFVARTYRYDKFISEEIERGADLVLNLAAGLDARPYRMALQSDLHWVEVDLPEILDYKEEILRGERPKCQLERVRLDLSDQAGRRQLFERLSKSAKRVVVVCEGLLIYLSADEVLAIGKDLSAQIHFQSWVVDLASPGLLQVLQQRMGKEVSAAGAPYKFGPPEGPEFFLKCGWKPVEVHSMLKTAAQLKRLSLFMRIISMMPESHGQQGSRPWGGACLLSRL